MAPCRINLNPFGIKCGREAKVGRGIIIQIYDKKGRKGLECAQSPKDLFAKNSSLLWTRSSLAVFPRYRKVLMRKQLNHGPSALLRSRDTSPCLNQRPRRPRNFRCYSQIFRDSQVSPAILEVTGLRMVVPGITAIIPRSPRITRSPGYLTVLSPYYVSRNSRYYSQMLRDSPVSPAILEVTGRFTSPGIVGIIPKPPGTPRSPGYLTVLGLFGVLA